jgi:preprotein translocase subunit SecB
MKNTMGEKSYRIIFPYGRKYPTRMFDLGIFPHLVHLGEILLLTVSNCGFSH